MTPSKLATVKNHVERSHADEGQEMQDGFCITYSEDTKLIKLFSGEDAYRNLSELSDVIVSKWLNGKWEDI